MYLSELYPAWKLGTSLKISRAMIYWLIKKHKIKPQRIVGQSRLYDPLAFKRVVDMGGARK